MTPLRDVAEKIFYYSVNASRYNTKDEVFVEGIESILKEVVFQTDDKWRATESVCLNEARKTIKLLEEKVTEARSAAIEEAAKAVFNHYAVDACSAASHRVGGDCAYWIAEKIRELKGKP